MPATDFSTNWAFFFVCQSLAPLEWWTHNREATGTLGCGWLWLVWTEVHFLVTHPVHAFFWFLFFGSFGSLKTI